MRARVEAARAIQRRRDFYNARIPPGFSRTFCALDEAGERRLEIAVRSMRLSARTIADLDCQAL